MLLMLPSYVREGVQVKHILKYKDTIGQQLRRWACFTSTWRLLV